MNYEDEVVETLAKKMTAEAKRRVRRMTCDDPCECRRNLYLTIDAIVKFSHDVFHHRPEFHAAIYVLAQASQEMAEAFHKMQTGKTIHL